MSDRGDLSAVERTAWLTAFCRHWATGRYSFDSDPFASWLAGRHPEQAPTHVARRTRIGVALRTARIDACVRHVAWSMREPWNYWAVGAGLDARWLRLHDAFGPQLAEYRELDYPGMLAAKAAMVEESPFAAAYRHVVTTPGELLGTLAAMTPTGRPTLVVLEGVLMYLHEAEQRRLLALLARAARRVVLLVDVYTASAVRQGNRARRRVLGGVDARFAWGPERADTFVREEGWRVEAADSLIRPVLEELLPLAAHLPLPASFLDGYVLVHASRGSSEIA